MVKSKQSFIETSFKQTIGILILVMLLGACSGGERGALSGVSRDNVKFHAIKSTKTKPLSLPKDLASKPLPAPILADKGGARDESERYLKQALPGFDKTKGVRDAKAEAYFARLNQHPSIRTLLAQKDADFRKGASRRLVEAWFGLNKYAQHYQAFWLNSKQEYQRLEALGVDVPYGALPRAN